MRVFLLSMFYEGALVFLTPHLVFLTLPSFFWPPTLFFLTPCFFNPLTLFFWPPILVFFDPPHLVFLTPTLFFWHVFKTVQKNQPSFFAGCSSGSKTASWGTSYTGAVCVWEFGMFTCMGRFLLILFLYYLENLLVGDLVFDRYWLSPDAGFHANHWRWGRLWFFRKWVVG